MVVNAGTIRGGPLTRRTSAPPVVGCRARQSIRAPVGANHHRGQMPTGGMPAADDVARVATVRGSFTRHPHHRAAALLDDLATVTAGHRS